MAAAGCGGRWPSTWTTTRGRPGGARRAGWALLARDQRDLPDREAPGLPPAALAELIANLERIGGPEEERP